MSRAKLVIPSVVTKKKSGFIMLTIPDEIADDVSRIIEKLCRKGYVQKTTNASDGRNADIIITIKGLDTMASLDHLDDGFIHLFRNLSEKEIKLLNSLLDKLRG